MEKWVISMSDCYGHFVKWVNECGIFYWNYENAKQIYTDLKLFCSQAISEREDYNFYEINEFEFHFNNLIYTLKKVN